MSGLDICQSTTACDRPRPQYTSGELRNACTTRRLAAFRKSAEVSTKPFIYLSAGVSNAEFTETLELCAEAGPRFSGGLCGGATWKDGIPIYGKQGADAFRKWLETEGGKNIANVNERLKAAHPWYEFYGAKSADELAV